MSRCNRVGLRSGRGWYERLHMGGRDAEKFEVTLLLNSLLGLMILPVEQCIRTQKCDFPRLFAGDELQIGQLGE